MGDFVDKAVAWTELAIKNAEIARLRAENERLTAALEKIAGFATDKLQTLQAKNALDNIGPSALTNG